MSKRDSFLKAIYEEPDDIALRLVFADWLEDRSDPLGEFIRVQCDLDQGCSEDRFGALCRREEELLREHRLDWLGEAAPLDQLDYPYDRAFTFSRGLPETVCLPVGVLVEQAELLAACPTVYRAVLFEVRDNGSVLANCPALRRFRAIEVADWITAGDVDAFTSSPHLAGLELLTIWLGNRNEFSVWEPTVNRLGRLRHVSLIQFWGGLLAGAEARWVNERTDFLAACFNHGRATPIAVVERPFDRYFPLAGEVNPGLFAGRQQSNRLLLAGVQYDGEWVSLAHFDSQGSLVGAERRTLRGVLTRKPEHEWERYNKSEVLDYLNREFGFELDQIRVKEFTTTELSVDLWGIHESYYIEYPDEVPEDEEDRRQAGVNLLGWLSSGNFAVTFGNQMWANDSGKVHTT